jgi:hypothetical protein
MIVSPYTRIITINGVLLLIGKKECMLIQVQCLNNNIQNIIEHNQDFNHHI